MQRITLSIDDDLAAALDRHMKSHRYTSRSEALRDILRGVEAGQRLDGEADRRAMASALPPWPTSTIHETATSAGDSPGRQHHHHDLQVATLHVHLDHSSCLEVAVLRGPWAPSEL